MKYFNEIMGALDEAYTFAGDDRPSLQKEIKLARNYIAEIDCDPDKLDTKKTGHIASLLRDTADAMDAAGLELLSGETSDAASKVDDLDSEERDEDD
jgi:hypothetical protein